MKSLRRVIFETEDGKFFFERSKALEHEAALELHKLIEKELPSFSLSEAIERNNLEETIATALWNAAPDFIAALRKVMKSQQLTAQAITKGADNDV